MKPGPATSIDSTQRSTAVLARSAAISSAATSRGLRRCALASGIAAVHGEVAVSGLARRLEGGGERVARAHFGHRCAQRVEQFFTGPASSGNSTRRVSRAPQRGAKSRASVNKAASHAAPAAPRATRRCKNSRPRPPPMSSAATAPASADAAARAAAMPSQIGKYRDPRPPRRRRDQRGLPRLRRLPGPQRRDQAGARRNAGDPIDSHYSERFFAAEAALVGRLQHPNVVQIFDAVPDPAAPYLVMEYVAGRTLRPYCRADQLLLARADRRDRLQVRDGARLRLSPGPDPSRRQAGQPARGAEQRRRSPTSRSATSAAS